VRVGKRGKAQVYGDPAEWGSLADSDRQIGTKGLWEKHYRAWGANVQAAAAKAAGMSFADLAEPFTKQHRTELDREKRALDEWLRFRTDQICGPVEAEQVKLIGGDAPDVSRWKTLTEPTERLASFATDGANKPADRREADGVLRLYKQRSEDLAKRTTLRVQDPTPLGILMLVPAAQGGR